MSYSNRTKQENDTPVIDCFADPVAYLASLGIEAELVEVTTTLPEAA